MKIYPRSAFGKWSLYLALAFIVFAFVAAPLSARYLYAGVDSNTGFLGDLSRRPLLAISGISGLLSGLASFVTGLLAIFKAKDRSVLIYVATLVGLVVVVFLVGELVGSE